MGQEFLGEEQRYFLFKVIYLKHNKIEVWPLAAWDYDIVIARSKLFYDSLIFLAAFIYSFHDILPMWGPCWDWGHIFQ